LVLVNYLVNKFSIYSFGITNSVIPSIKIFLSLLVNFCSWKC